MSKKASGLVEQLTFSLAILFTMTACGGGDSSSSTNDELKMCYRLASNGGLSLMCAFSYEACADVQNSDGDVTGAVYDSLDDCYDGYGRVRDNYELTGNIADPLSGSGSGFGGDYRRIDTNDTVLVLDGSNSYSCSWKDCGGSNTVCGVKVQGNVSGDILTLAIPNSSGGADDFDFLIDDTSSTTLTIYYNGSRSGDYEKMSYLDARSGSNGVCD